MCLITKHVRINAENLYKRVSEYLCNQANIQANRVFVSTLIGIVRLCNQ